MTAGILQAHWSKHTRVTHTTRGPIGQLSWAGRVGNYEFKGEEEGGKEKNSDQGGMLSVIYSDNRQQSSFVICFLFVFVLLSSSSKLQ